MAGHPGGSRRHNMQPRPKVKNPGKTFKRLIGLITRRYKVQFILVFVCIIISVLSSVQGTLFIKNLIDDYIVPMKSQPTPDFTPLLLAILRVAVFYLIGALANYAQSRIMVYVTQGTMRDLRCDLFQHMESLPVKYFDTHPHGDIMSVYTNDVDTLRQMISQGMPQIFNSAITIVSVLISMFAISVPLTLVTLAMVFAVMMISKSLMAKSSKYFLAQQTDLGKQNGYIEEMMKGQKVVKVFNHEKKSLEEFKELNDTLFHSSYNANMFANILMPINAQMGNLSYVLCAIVGGALATAASGFFGITLGSLVSFLSFNKSFSQPINQVSQQINSIVMALAGAERITLPLSTLKRSTASSRRRRNAQAYGRGSMFIRRQVMWITSVCRALWSWTTSTSAILPKRPYCTTFQYMRNRVRRSPLSVLRAPAKQRLLT